MKEKYSGGAHFPVSRKELKQQRQIERRKREWPPIPRKNLNAWYDHLMHDHIINTAKMLGSELRKLQDEIDAFDKKHDSYRIEMIRTGIEIITKELLAFDKDKAVAERRELLEYFHGIEEYLQKVSLLIY